MESGTLIAQKYRLKQKIGDGATSEVWAASHAQTARPVAIKLILRSSEVFKHRLLREARICGEISHRNVIEVLDAGQLENGDAYLVMPLLQGETLAALIERQFRIEVPLAAQIGRDVARALAAAHAKTIIHRDLKPANIFLHNEPGGEGAVVRVLDFGIGKNLSAEESVATIAGGMLGSPAYMSPEQVRCDPNVDHRSDIWSLGVVLFEMITGRRPFDGSTAQEVVGKIARGDVPKLSRYVRNIDRSLEALVWHCMQADRERRAKSAADIAKILDGFTQGGEGSRVMTELPTLERKSAPVELSPGLQVGVQTEASTLMKRPGAQPPQARAATQSPLEAELIPSDALTDAEDDAGPTLQFGPRQVQARHPPNARPVASAYATPLPVQAPPSVSNADRDQAPASGFVRAESTIRIDPNDLAAMGKAALGSGARRDEGPRGTKRLGPQDTPPPSNAIASAAARATMPLPAPVERPSVGFGSGVWPSPAEARGAAVTTNVPLSFPPMVPPPSAPAQEVRTKLSMQPARSLPEWDEARMRRMKLAMMVGMVAAVVVVVVVLGSYSLLGRAPDGGVGTSSETALGSAEAGADASVVAAVPTVVPTVVVSAAPVVGTAAGTGSSAGKAAVPVGGGKVGGQGAVREVNPKADHMDPGEIFGFREAASSATAKPSAKGRVKPAAQPAPKGNPPKRRFDPSNF